MFFFTVLARIGAVLGAIVVVATINSQGAAQQAAGAAIGIAMAVLPYVMARSIQMAKESDDRAAKSHFQTEQATYQRTVIRLLEEAARREAGSHLKSPSNDLPPAA